MFEDGRIVVSFVSAGSDTGRWVVGFCGGGAVL